MIKPEGVKCLPACVVVAAYRNHNNGTVNNAGSNANMNNNRANGFSVRCLKDWEESLLLNGGRDFYIFETRVWT